MIVDDIFKALRATGAAGATMDDIRSYAGKRSSVSSLVGELVRDGRLFKCGSRPYTWYFLSAADAAVFTLVDHIELRVAAAKVKRKAYWHSRNAGRVEIHAAARKASNARKAAAKPKPLVIVPIPFVTVPVSNVNTPWRMQSRKGQPRGKHEPVPITIPAGMVVQRAPHGGDHRHTVRHDEIPLVFSALRPGQYLETA